ncbi:MAG TPA: hypothetical protein VF695_03755 [Sphingomonas sp.]|jgi:hypothetical protein
MGTDNPILMVLLGCVIASLLLVAIGFWLKRSGKLTTRGAALGWAVLSVLPLFGAGAAMMTKHTAEAVTGETAPGETRHPGE